MLKKCFRQLQTTKENGKEHKPIDDESGSGIPSNSKCNNFNKEWLNVLIVISQIL